MEHQRTILHMDLDTFFVSVERLLDTSLEGKPVIVGGKEGRGVVASCSYETRKFGVHSAMPMRQALQLCPDAIVVSSGMENYSIHSKKVTKIILDKAPLFEKASIDEFYLDLTGMDTFFDTYKWATELRETIIRETGLPISWGMGSSKMVAKMATGFAKPNGQKRILPGEEEAFLFPLNVRKIPGCGEKTCETLKKMGIEYIHQLAEANPEWLAKVFGVYGPSLHRRARGLDSSEVTPYHDAKSASAERTFDKDTTDTVFLATLIRSLIERVGFQIRKDGQLASCVAIRIRYSDFSTVSKQIAIPYTASDHVFFEKAMELFEQLYEKGRPVRLAGVKLSNLLVGGHQINMFDEKPEDIQLYKALDKIKLRYGANTVMRASSMNVMSKRPIITSFDKRID